MEDFVSAIDSGSLYNEEVSDEVLVPYIFQKMFGMSNMFRTAKATGRRDLVYDNFVKLLDFALKGKPCEDVQTQKDLIESLSDIDDLDLLDGAVDFLSPDDVKKYIDSYGINAKLISTCTKFASLYEDFVAELCRKLGDSDLSAVDFNMGYWDSLSLLTANTISSISDLWNAMDEVTCTFCKLLDKVDLESSNSVEENIKCIYQKWCDFIKNGIKAFYWDDNNSAIGSFLFNLGIYLNEKNMAVIRKVIHGEEPSENGEGEKILEDLDVWSLEDLKINMEGDDVEVLLGLSPRLVQFCVKKGGK